MCVRDREIVLVFLFVCVCVCGRVGVRGSACVLVVMNV